MPDDIYFTSDNLNFYLKELAKEFRKLNGKVMPAEITLIGGAAILANYGFRDKTYDIDAIIKASSAMEDAVRTVEDKYNLPVKWLNSDFTKTESYSPKLEQYSQYYRTYCNILTIRVISSEYLVAMKLMAGRKYKHDLSDAAQIIKEHQQNGNELTEDKIYKAITDLYGSIDEIPKSSIEFLHSVLTSNNLDELIKARKEIEENAKRALIQFEKEYEDVLNENNLNDILNTLNSHGKKVKKHNDYDDR